jgi:hypothetical protein
MKFTTFKQIISLVFIFLILGDSYSCIERKFSSNYSFSRRLNKSGPFSDAKDLINGVIGVEKKVEKKLTLNLNNPFLRLISGIVESLGNNNTGWIKCLPEEWRSEEPNLQKAGFIQKQFEQMHVVVQALSLIIKHGVKIACNPGAYLKAAILDLLGVMFTAAGDLKKYVSKKIAERKDKPKSQPGFGTKILNKIKDVNHYVREKFKLAWNELSEPVRDVIKTAGETVVEFVKELIEFFKSEDFADIIKVLKCIGSGAMMAYEIGRVIYGFYDKIQLLITASGSSYGAAVVPVLAKMAWGILCKFEEFGLAINFAAEAITTEKLKDKTFYWGKFIGQVIHAIGTSRRKMLKRRFRRYYK